MSEQEKVCTNSQFCDYRFTEINKKLDDLHGDIKDLHKTVRNGISDKIGECHTQLKTHDTHIRIQWWFIGALLTAIGAVSFFVFEKLMG